MIDIPCGRNKRYGSSFLCMFLVLILVICTSTSKPDVDNLLYAASDNASSISSPGNLLCDIISNELTSHSIIKNIASRSPSAGRFACSRAGFFHDVIRGSYTLTGTCVHFFRDSYIDLFSCHHFIISYIHNLDGMKP